MRARSRTRRPRPGGQPRFAQGRLGGGQRSLRESGIGGPDDTDQLKARITTLEQQVVDLELKLGERDEDPAAARAANRELMAQFNRRTGRPEG